jgi:hypothetical protein
MYIFASSQSRAIQCFSQSTMKQLLIFFMTIGMAKLAMAQNTGIGTSTPVSALHTATSVSNVLTLENTNPLVLGITSGLNFAAGINSVNSYKYIGAIRAIGTSTSEGRLGLFTFASNTPNGLAERITILNNGNVGINNTNPQYDLSVNGSGYFTNYVGIQTAPSSSYALSVSGSARYYGDLRVDGVLNPNNTLDIGNNTTIEGTLTVENGKGIVRSFSSTQMKIKRAAVGLSAVNLGAGASIESGYLNFGDDFTAVTVIVGQPYNSTGDYFKVLLVPFDVDVVNDRCRFKLTNVANSAITFDSDWDIMLIGN